MDQTTLKRVHQLLNTEEENDSFFLGCPIPVWLKRCKKDKIIMDKVNPAYTKYTGISLKAYKGREDEDVYDHKTGEEFGDNDKKVIERRAPVRTQELIVNPLSNKEEYWIGWKFPYINNAGIVIGIWGIALPVEKESYTPAIKEFVVNFF